MLEQALKLIAGRLEGLELFNRVYDIAEITYDGEKKGFPTIYKSKTERAHIEYDSLFAGCYMRRNGKVKINEVSPDDMITSCDNAVLITYPLMLVALINKSKADCNHGYEDDFFAQKIISVLTGGLNLSGTQWARAFSNGYETDNQIIIRTEYPNQNIVDFNYEYSYLSIDFTLTYQADAACLNPCNVGYGY